MTLGKRYAYPVTLSDCYRYSDVYIIEQAPVWRGEGYRYWLQFRDSAGVCYHAAFERIYSIVPQCSKAFGSRYMLMPFDYPKDGIGRVGIFDLDHVANLCQKQVQPKTVN